MITEWFRKRRQAKARAVEQARLKDEAKAKEIYEKADANAKEVKQALIDFGLLPLGRRNVDPDTGRVTLYARYGKTIYLVTVYLKGAVTIEHLE